MPDSDPPPLPKYKEHPLPADCPPLDGQPVGDCVVLRLVETNPPTADDFRSSKAECGQCPPGKDICRWHSCSVWVPEVKLERIAGLRKFPKLRSKKFVAHVNVPANSGRIKPHDGDPQHLSFWMYETFFPEASIKMVLTL